MRATPLVVALALTCAGPPVTDAAPTRTAAENACGPAVRVSAVAGAPGTWRIETPQRTFIARAATASAVAAPDVIVDTGSFFFNADGNLATQVDTVHVTVGQTVRWHLSGGFHTVTNGTDSLDPSAGALFDVTLDSTSPDFDFTFNDPGVVPYFCAFHEFFNMRGVVQVLAAASVPGPGAARAGFTRPPAPNPARDGVAFSVRAPRAGAASIEVLDLTGRRVATVFRGVLDAGERAFRWDGRDASGRAAAPGSYRLRFLAGGTSDSRGIVLIR